MASVAGVFVGTVVRNADPATVAVTGIEAGDVLVAVEGTNIPSGFSPTVSGCGATWSLITASDAGAGYGARAWIGTGATTDGTISASGGPSGSGVNGRAVTAYVLRGVTATVAASAKEASTSAVAPALPAGPGQVVIGAGYSDNASGAMYAHTPAAGWTDQAGTEVGLSRYYRTTHRAPGEASPHSVEARRTGPAVAMVVVVGDPSGPSGPTLAATLTATTGGSATLSGTQVTAATLTATTGGSAALTATVETTADLTVTTGGSAAIDTVAPGTVEATAALTATTSGTAALTGTHPAAADLTATTSGAAALGRTVTAAATLTVATGGTAVLDEAVPGVVEGSATLTATTGGTAALGGTHVASATLTVTTGGEALLGQTGDGLSAALTAESGGSFSPVLIEDGGTLRATLTAVAGGSFGGSAYADLSAALTAVSGGSFRPQRDYVVDPGTNLPRIRLFAAKRDGTRMAELHDADITSEIVTSLNDIDGSGSGLSFSIPKTSRKNQHLDQFEELHVECGGQHIDTFVLLRSQDESASPDIPWQTKGIGWYLTGRFLAPVYKENLVRNGSFEQGRKYWTGGYRIGSIPAKAPHTTVVTTDTVTGNKALRVEGSLETKTTVTTFSSDTTFAPGSATLKSGAKTELRDWVREHVEVDNNPNDLVDIEPPVITITGHTDSNPHYGSMEANWQLSLDRAKAVASYLRTVLPREHTIVTRGMAWTQPVASNATAAGQAKNRRVEIKYPQSKTARGHRQYREQRIRYTNPSRRLTRNLSLVAWGTLESYKEPNADGSVLWVGRRPVPGTKPAPDPIRISYLTDNELEKLLAVGWRKRKPKKKGEDPIWLDPPTGERLYDTQWVATADVKIDEETALGTPTRWETSIEVPPDGKEWEIVVRLTPPAGTVVYDEVGLYPDNAMEFWNVDVAHIIRDIVRRAQDPEFGKSDLNIGTRTPRTGIKRDIVFYDHERWTAADAIAELLSHVDAPDITFETTPTKRVLTTHYPRAGRHSGLVLSTEGMIEEYDLALDGEQTATTTIVQSDGQGPDREEGVATGTSGTGGLVIERAWSAEPFTPIRRLRAKAEQAHGWFSKPVAIARVTMFSKYTTKLVDSVGLGDLVDIDIRSPLRLERGTRRITRRSLDPDLYRISYQPTMEDL